MRVWWVGAVTLVLLVAGCGGGGGGAAGTTGSRLSSSAYRVQLRKIFKEFGPANAATYKAFQTSSVQQLVTALTAYTASIRRSGDEVAALSPPTNAEAANAQLAKGEQDTVAEIDALLPKIKNLPSTQAADAYLSNRFGALGSAGKGGREIGQAVAKLKRLGYIKSGG